MEPVFLAGVDVDRCYLDEQLWLDAGEPALILDRAQAQVREQPWFTALIQRLFG
jgi:Zn-finger nucleic acid-binding protein